MDNQMLIEQLTSGVEGVPPVPPRAEIMELRQHSLDELLDKTTQFLDVAGEAFRQQWQRRDLVTHKDRTIVNLPLGARAILYHASGAMKIVTGLMPMESLFEKPEEQDQLVDLVKEATNRLDLTEMVKKDEALRFERLWQIKAAAENRKGQLVEPILCRAIGTYRHFVGELPVWGAASLAIELASEGQLDSLTVQIRETTGEVVDKVEILRPELAAHHISLQLTTLKENSKLPMSEVVKPRTFRFGYLSLSKRKAQRLLTPVYIAEIEIAGEEETQAYVLVTPATEKTYLPIPNGREALPTTLSRTES